MTNEEWQEKIGGIRDFLRDYYKICKKHRIYITYWVLSEGGNDFEFLETPDNSPLLTHIAELLEGWGLNDHLDGILEIKEDEAK